MKKLLFIFLLFPMLSFAQSNEGKEIKGTGSFYALRFNGLRTATGEVFKHSNLTAASNNFKINTWVKVTNLSNNQSVIVRINDRMHKSMSDKGRVIDLTSAAAKSLGVTIKGLIKVKVETVTM